MIYALAGMAIPKTEWLLRVLVLAGLLTTVFLCILPVQASGEYEIAVMPFVRGRDPGDPEKTITCSFGGLSCRDAGLKENANRILTETAQGELVRRLGHRVVPLERVRMAYHVGNLESAEQTLLDAAKDIGKALEVDYVLTGSVWRFKERIGRSYGVEKPASVAFGLFLVDTETGKTIWRKIFDETQQSLSENLLRAPQFFRRGAKWLTARELAEYGIKEVMENFPLQ